VFCVVRTLRWCVFSAHPGRRFRDKGQYSDMDQSEPGWSPPLSSWSDTHPRFQGWPFNTSWKYQSCWSDRICCAEDTAEEPTNISVWGTFHCIIHSCIGQQCSVFLNANNILVSHFSKQKWSFLYLYCPYCCVILQFCKCRISRPIRRTFFPEKCDLNSNCVLYAEGKYLFPKL
jgi:hypothetical protein